MEALIEEREPAQVIPFKRRKQRLPVMYLRPSDVSRITGISRTKVFMALYSGELKGYQEPDKNGKPKSKHAWSITVADMHRWIRGADYVMQPEDYIYVEAAS
jgi:hypothetical protein